MKQPENTCYFIKISGCKVKNLNVNHHKFHQDLSKMTAKSQGQQVHLRNARGKDGAVGGASCTSPVWVDEGLNQLWAPECLCHGNRSGLGNGAGTNSLNFGMKNDYFLRKLSSKL